jgi:hypothetical protein
MLDRTRVDRTALPLARGILEPPAERDSDDDAALDDDDVVAEELAPAVLVLVLAAVARCAPSLAMMREREMRGLRVDGCAVVFVIVDDEGDAGARLVVDADVNADEPTAELWVASPAAVVVVAASVVAATAREVGLMGGGMSACLGDISSSGVVNIFPGDDEPAPPLPRPRPPRGLFVIASRTAALRGGVLAR